MEFVLVLLMCGDVLCPKDVVTDVEVDVDPLRRTVVVADVADVTDVAASGVEVALTAGVPISYALLAATSLNSQRAQRPARQSYVSR